jgi:hypothetical protein
VTFLALFIQKAERFEVGLLHLVYIISNFTFTPQKSPTGGLVYLPKLIGASEPVSSESFDSKAVIVSMPGLAS